jgi:damage-control phosphatase, subfamily I
MSIKVDCIPCIIKQALYTARVSKIKDEKIHFDIIKNIYEETLRFSEEMSAPRFAATIKQIVYSYSGIEDPFKEIKEENLKKALNFISYLKTYINSSSDPLEEAVRIAILGNIIDLGANPEFNLADEISKISSNNIRLDDYSSFKKKIKNAPYILYIGDNAEEAVFDKLLIEQLLPKNIIFAVREVPILNDITMDFAEKIGLDKAANIISSGSTIPGTDMNDVNENFKNIFYKAPMVIAKGQGNFETLMNEKREIYFMFKIKCEVVSKICGNPIGTSMLYHDVFN